jgi:6-pyruvoyltetrahydropterin/6-carboxytetrahydropterin synthase
MYQVALIHHFEAQHFLAGVPLGKESDLHSHQYTIEICIEGPELNDKGFLIDIVSLEEKLKKKTEELEGRVLNDLPEFSGINPSIERIAAYICDNIEIEDGKTELASMRVKVWENDKAWASCIRDLMQVP